MRSKITPKRKKPLKNKNSKNLIKTLNKTQYLGIINCILWSFIVSQKRKIENHFNWRYLFHIMKMQIQSPTKRQ